MTLTLVDDFNRISMTTSIACCVRRWHNVYLSVEEKYPCPVFQHVAAFSSPTNDETSPEGVSLCHQMEQLQLE